MSAVALICANQDIAASVMQAMLTWVPIASAWAWFIARYNMLPPWAERILQASALNIVHALAGDPHAAPK